MSGRKGSTHIIDELGRLQWELTAYGEFASALGQANFHPSEETLEHLGSLIQSAVGDIKAIEQELSEGQPS